VPYGDRRFELWWTPRWLPWVAAPLLVFLLFANAGLAYVLWHERGSGRSALPLLIAINTAAALILLVRLWVSVVPRDSRTGGLRDEKL
jgi:hypothetical protein